LALILSVIIAFLARWQAAFFLVVFVTMSLKLNPIRHHRVLCVILLIAALTIVYPSMSVVFTVVEQVASEGAIKNEGSGIYSSMIAIQGSYGYFIVVIPKTIQMMFGSLMKVGSLFPWEDFYNDVMLVWHAAVALALLVALGLSGRFRIRNDFVYASVVYCVIFALTPIYAPRYFLPVYVFWAMAMSLPKEAAGDLLFAPGGSI
jgi:hypothetical protein